MQSFRIPPTIFETFPRTVTSVVSRASASASTSTSRQFRATPQTQISSTKPKMASFQEYKIENTTFPTAPSVNLDENQKVILGSVLDLFAGRPSLRKLSLWQDNATFADPITIAEGRKQYAAQWYGLKAAFSQIERLGGQVTSGGNPIELDMKTRYVVKGIGKEQTIDSKIKIWTEGEGSNMKIKRVEDRWDDELPDSTFKNAMRNLNSVIVPTMVSVPKSIEEEEASSK